ncbi:SHOCT domain-containing protein [Piscinibacter sp.]|uniref:SHOCT domain-containing protein n=1 Tax=Piscinibacter sp. TaxID=1903157 RepID=UPI002BAE788F|nr:SHOCT domain-containing protein [Albitalea sp.]HUG24491.1 SHOCT domain-containing protein [Albitalea sp.]
MFNGMGYMGGMHVWWWLLWIVVIGAVLYFVWVRPAPRGDRTNETPHEALRRRLAAGEITQTEYESRKALLDRDIGPGKA